MSEPSLLQLRKRTSTSNVGAVRCQADVEAAAVQSPTVVILQNYGYLPPQLLHIFIHSPILDGSLSAFTASYDFPRET